MDRLRHLTLLLPGFLSLMIVPWMIFRSFKPEITDTAPAQELARDPPKSVSFLHGVAIRSLIGHAQIACRRGAGAKEGARQRGGGQSYRYAKLLTHKTSSVVGGPWGALANA